LSNFEKGWKRQDREGFGQRTRDAIRGPQPIRPQIQKATNQLNQEINRLDGSLNRLRQREQAIFKKTVGAVRIHDDASSKTYANELAEAKKMSKIVTQSKVALEQISLRLQTVTDIGDFATALTPAIGVVRSVRKTLGNAMPDAQQALGDIGSTLSSIMMDVGGVTGTDFFSGEPNEEAEKIMQEAAAVAEKRMTESFPEVPSSSNESIFGSTG